MSHNANTLNSQPPDRQGAITHAISNLSDVTAAAPQNEQLLISSSDSWILGTAAKNSVLTASHIPGEGQSASSLVYDPALEYGGYFISARAVGSDGAMIQITQDTTYATAVYRVYNSNSQYLEYIELASGHVYHLYLEFCIAGNSDAGASIEVQWQDQTGNSLGPRVFLRQKGENRTPVRGVIDLTSASGTTNVGLRRVGSGVTGNARYAITADDTAQFNLTVRILS